MLKSTLKRSLLIAAIGALSTTPLLGQQAKSAKPGKVEEEVLAAERARVEGVVKGDTAALGKMLGEDLTYAHSSGRVDTKAQFLASLKSGDLKYESMEHEGLAARIYGNTAVVTGTSRVKVKSSGQDLNLHIRFTCIWVKRDGRWQMVAWQSTRLPQE